MFPYKVIHLDSTIQKKKGWMDPGGQFDGITTSKEIEALLIEKDNEGYDLISIVPVTSYKLINGSFAASYTSGFVITLKKKEIEA